jgi:hypothetical protein
MFRFAQTADVPAHIEVAFEDGIPVAVNGIAMSLPELTESLTTIAEDHGFAGTACGAEGVTPVLPLSDGALADAVLAHARAALSFHAGDDVSGIVRMRLHDGEHTIDSVSPAALAHHA